MTKIRKGTDGRPLFVWVVEIGVSKTWVEDGFILDKDQLVEMVRSDLCYSTESEVAAEILDGPDLEMIAKAQGYDSAVSAGL